MSNPLIIRKSEESDIAQIATLYDGARQLLKSNGINQWQDGYPNAQSARDDMLSGVGYVITDKESVLGSACIAFGVEPTYLEIHNGSWFSDTDKYGFLHRVVVSPMIKGRGLAKMFFSELERQARDNGTKSLRCDTHRENLRMQKTLENNGFAYRGIIYLENGDERFAYEKILEP